MRTKTKPRERGVIKDRSNFNEYVKQWASYYRANMHRFSLDYLGVSLKPFQMILLYMMSISELGITIASRGKPLPPYTEMCNEKNLGKSVKVKFIF